MNVQQKSYSRAKADGTLDLLGNAGFPGICCDGEASGDVFCLFAERRGIDACFSGDSLDGCCFRLAVRC